MARKTIETHPIGNPLQASHLQKLWPIFHSKGIADASDSDSVSSSSQDPDDSDTSEGGSNDQSSDSGSESDSSYDSNAEEPTRSNVVSTATTGSARSTRMGLSRGICTTPDTH